MTADRCRYTVVGKLHVAKENLVGAKVRACFEQVRQAKLWRSVCGVHSLSEYPHGCAARAYSPHTTFVSDWDIGL